MVTQAVKPWVRVGILVVGVLTLVVVARLSTGSWLPSKPEHTLLFQNGLLLVVLGSAILEQHFTRPAEALVNSLTGLSR